MGGSGLFMPKSHPNRFWKRAIIELITLLKNDVADELSTVTVMQSGVDGAVANAGNVMVDARIIARIIDKIFFMERSSLRFYLHQNYTAQTNSFQKVKVLSAIIDTFLYIISHFAKKVKHFDIKISPA